MLNFEFSTQACLAAGLNITPDAPATPHNTAVRSEALEKHIFPDLPADDPIRQSAENNVVQSQIEQKAGQVTVQQVVGAVPISNSDPINRQGIMNLPVDANKALTTCKRIELGSYRADNK